MVQGRGRGRGNPRTEVQRDPRDEEIEALRKQVEELTRRLEHQETLENPEGSDSQDEDYNPLYFRDLRDERMGGGVNLRENRYADRERYFDFKIEIPDFNGRLNPEEMLVGSALLRSFFIQRSKCLITRR
jgi:hypothetical protein